MSTYIAYMLSFEETSSKIGLSLDAQWMSSPRAHLNPFLFHTEQQGKNQQNLTDFAHLKKYSGKQEAEKQVAAVYKNLRIKCILNNVLQWNFPKNY